MARFFAFYSLCPTEDIKEFRGLSKDRESGNVITTLGRNIIIIIKLSTQKQIRSWTILDKLSTKVVYDPKSEQYVGVFAQHFIRCWKENENDINKKKKIKKAILDLIATENDETIMLYADGSCEYLSVGIDSRKTNQKNESETPTYPKIEEANIFELADGQKMLTYFTECSATGNRTLVTVTLDNQTGRPLNDLKKFKLDRRDQNIKLAGKVVVEGENGPFLLTLWSDRRIFTLPLRYDTNEADSPGNFISMMNILNVDSSVSILAISKNCIAMYGSNSAQEGSSLLLYNTQFRVTSAKQFFKVYFDHSRLWVIGNNILLAMGHNLYVISFNVSRELLSEMIGSQVSNDVEEQLGKEFINDELEEELFFNNASNKSSFKRPHHENLQIEMKLADGKVFPYQNFRAFSENLQTIVQHKTIVNVNYSDGPTDALHIMSHSNDNSFPTEELEVIAKSLEECGASEQEITEKILSIALRAQLISDVIICVKRYSNVSQKLLAKTIKFALNELTMDDLIKKSEGGDKHSIIDQKICLLNAALSCSFDSSAILSSLKKELNFEEALLLIQYLYHIISVDSKNGVLEERPECNLNFDEDVRIMQWLSIILNAHFQGFGLSQNPHLVEILNKWKELIVSYQHNLRDLQSLQAVIKNIIDGKSLSKENKHCKWYSIEEVKLF